MEPYIGSIIYFALAIFGVEVFGYRIFADTYSGRNRMYLVEFIATLQACLCVMECGAVLIYYGIPGFLIALTFCGILIRYTKRDAYINPAKVLSHAIFANLPALEAVLLVVLQLVAAFAAFQLGTLFWRLKLNTLRENLYHTSFACSSAAKIPLIMGVGVTAFAACFNDLINAQCYKRFGQHEAHIISSLISAIIVVICVDICGMYPQPIFATISTLGCPGSIFNEPTLMSWLGPVIGLFVAPGLRHDAFHSRRAFAKAHYAR